MNKLTILLLAIGTTAVLTACNNNDATAKVEKEATPLKANLTVPSTANMGDKVQFQVKITQNGKPVTDISDVAFEVENTEADIDQMLPAKQKNHAYIATMTVKEAGEYNITAHVSSKDDKHVMPDANMVVAAEDVQHSHDDAATTTDSATEEHAHEHTGDVAVVFDQNSAAKGESTFLSVSVKHDNTALTDAQVRFQVTPPNNEEPFWITLKETSDGHYETKHTFDTTGTYNLKLHVEKDDGLHHHEEQIFTVK